MKTKEQKQNRNFVVFNISIILLLIAMAMGSAVSAQPPGGGSGGNQQGPPELPSAKQIKKMVTKLSGELSLSEEQETEVLALYQEHFAEMEEATESGRPDRTKMDKLKSTFEGKVKAVLTTDQQKLYTEYLKENQPQRR